VVNTSRDYDSTFLTTILRNCAYNFAHSNCHPFLPFLPLTGLYPSVPLTPVPVPTHYVSFPHSVASEEACEACQSANISNPCSPPRSRSRNEAHGSHANRRPARTVSERLDSWSYGCQLEMIFPFHFLVPQISSMAWTDLAWGNSDRQRPIAIRLRRLCGSSRFESHDAKLLNRLN
jgi:hypothetical protein